MRNCYRSLLVMMGLSLTPTQPLQGRSLSADLRLAHTHQADGVTLPAGWKILQFWASWCVSCDHTMQTLGNLREHNHMTPFELIPISVDEKCQDVAQYFAAKPHVASFANQVRRDPGGKLAQLLKLRGIPTVMLVNPEGQIVQEFVGHPNASQLQALREHLQTLPELSPAQPSH